MSVCVCLFPTPQVRVDTLWKTNMEPEKHWFVEEHVLLLLRGADLNGKRQIAVGSVGPQQQVPIARSRWVLPGRNTQHSRQLQTHNTQTQATTTTHNHNHKNTQHSRQLQTHNTQTQATTTTHNHNHKNTTTTHNHNTQPHSHKHTTTNTPPPPPQQQQQPYEPRSKHAKTTLVKRGRFVHKTLQNDKVHLKIDNPSAVYDHKYATNSKHCKTIRSNSKPMTSIFC